MIARNIIQDTGPNWNQTSANNISSNFAVCAKLLCSMLWIHIAGCDAGPILRGRKIVEQRIGSVPTQHHKESSGWLQICSQNVGLGSQQQWMVVVTPKRRPNTADHSHMISDQ